MAERVVDKDRANFCEYFGPATQGAATDKGSQKSASRADLENLFKKKN